MNAITTKKTLNRAQSAKLGLMPDRVILIQSIGKKGAVQLVQDLGQGRFHGGDTYSSHAAALAAIDAAAI